MILCQVKWDARFTAMVMKEKRTRVTPSVLVRVFRFL